MNTKKIFGYGLIAIVLVMAFAACEQPNGKTLAGITLNTGSVKKDYIQNETLDLSGLVVTANYSDGSKAAVADYTADPASGAALSAPGSTTVTVSYTEGTVTKTADFSVTVTAKTLIGITAEYTGTTHHVYTFTLRDSLKDHLTVTAKYNDGTSAELEPKDYELSGELTAGTSTITASYTEGGVTKIDTFNVTVIAATLDSIAVAFNQDDATIYTSTPLDNIKQYLTVTATYTFTGSQETHEEELEADEYELSGKLTVGTPTIIVNYGDKTGNFTPTVTAVVLVSITAQYATATVYTSTPSDNLKQYLTVKASYNDGSEKPLSANDYTLNGTLTAGTPTITASYTEDSVTKTATFTPTVTAVALASITANYTGGDVEINSNIDNLKTALTVKVHYNDGSTQLASNYSLSGTLTAIGQKTITATYEGKTTTFNVTVVCTHDWNTETGLCNNSCGELYYKIGDTGPGGGEIFYRITTGFTVEMVNPTQNYTAHYLEAAPADMATTLAWASSAFVPPAQGGTGDWVDITGTGEAIGTGRKNTALILATDTNAPAAKACNEYSNGGKTDWFLPSIGELNQLYVNRTSVSSALSLGWYSSSSHSNNIGFALRLFFSDGSEGNCDKGFPNPVRAVRAF